MLGACMEILATHTTKFNGTVIKTIGDNLMCVFDDPARAVLAANEMQQKVKIAIEAQDSVAVHVEIGMHFGDVLDEGDDVFGDTVNTAARIGSEAGAGQILITEAVMDQLPGMFASMTRFFDEAPLRGKAETVRIFEVIWEVSDLTMVHNSTVHSASRSQQTSCKLTVAGAHWVVDAKNSSIVMGRGATVDMLVPTPLSSREHARVELNRGTVTLVDHSSNGTYVMPDNDALLNVRNDRVVLVESGYIGLGEPPAADAPNVIRYQCDVREG